MKVKRIISALAALAMSVSCLAGLTITVNAEIPSNTIDENFEGVVSEDWTKHDGAFNTSNSGAYGADPAVATESENSNKYLKWSCTGKNDRNGRGMYIGLPSTPIDKQYQLVKFDFAYNTWWANNATQDGMYLLDSNGKKIVSLNFEGAKATSETDNAVNTNSSITVNKGC